MGRLSISLAAAVAINCKITIRDLPDNSHFLNPVQLMSPEGLHAKPLTLRCVSN